MNGGLFYVLINIQIPRVSSSQFIEKTRTQCDSEDPKAVLSGAKEEPRMLLIQNKKSDPSLRSG